MALIPIVISYKYTHSVPSQGIIMDFFVNPLPSIMTIIVLSYSTILNIVYKDELIKHFVSDEYYGYNLLYLVLISLQLMLLVKYIFDLLSDKFRIPSTSTPGKAAITSDDTMYKFGIYLFSTFNIILLSIMQVILKYFSTDG